MAADGVDTSIVAPAKGAVNAKAWLLTATACVAVKPSPVAVIVSLPLLTAVIVNVAVPVEPVVTEGGVNVLPSAECSATV